MPLQVGALTEALHALVTLVGLLPGVSHHVELEVAFLLIALCALVTLVGLLPGVSPHVDLQVAFQTEALHALVTLIGLLQLPAVTGHVGGGCGVNTQTLCGGAALRAAVSKSITVFCRGRKKKTK